MDYVLVGALMGAMFAMEFLIAMGGFWLLDRIETRNVRDFKTNVKLILIILGLVVLMGSLLGFAVWGTQTILS